MNSTLRRWLYSIGIGLTITFLLVVLIASKLFPPIIGKILLWPVLLLTLSVGPGPNIRTPENPVYEGTPVDIFAALFGIVLTFVFYTLLVYLALRLSAKRKRAEIK